VNFLNIALKEPQLKNPIFNQSTGSANQANIGMGVISNWVLPVPPLTEQHRIVAKVDELMAICDQLKVKLQQSQETQAQLTDTLVDRALG
jgi:type I restriction enzyme S subunit|tara:strand:- start:287 stop:556 length:270 start_codon:yes stop_codon:yes gene_type:complete